ncbi:unnamed protein product [Moneuplotes crassus]|uniref:Uncharacterized protein n=1 Tax=Euplotes crassus TaxID=5936 RepID=A0AAD1U4Z0_EUPCR|nr:unnamed protein product [Moneuplotes crassus]
MLFKREKEACKINEVISGVTYNDYQHLRLCISIQKCDELNKIKSMNQVHIYRKRKEMMVYAFNYVLLIDHLVALNKSKIVNNAKDEYAPTFQVIIKKLG